MLKPSGINRSAEATAPVGVSASSDRLNEIFAMVPISDIGAVSVTTVFDEMASPLLKSTTLIGVPSP